MPFNVYYGSKHIVWLELSKCLLNWTLLLVKKKKKEKKTRKNKKDSEIEINWKQINLHINPWRFFF